MSGASHCIQWPGPVEAFVAEPVRAVLRRSLHLSFEQAPCRRCSTRPSSGAWTGGNSSGGPTSASGVIVRAVPVEAGRQRAVAFEVGDTPRRSRDAATTRGSSPSRPSSATARRCRRNWNSSMYHDFSRCAMPACPRTRSDARPTARRDGRPAPARTPPSPTRRPRPSRGRRRARVRCRGGRGSR